jgi:hypothetical protein
VSVQTFEGAFGFGVYLLCWVIRIRVANDDIARVSRSCILTPRAFSDNPVAAI